MSEQNNFLTFEDIEGTNDFVYEIVDLPEWEKNGKPGQLMVRNATSMERDRWERSVQGIDPSTKTKGAKNNASQNLRKEANRAYMVAMCTVHPVSKLPLFRDATAAINMLSRKSSAPISRLFDKIMELSGVTKEDLDELEGEFEENPTIDSATE